MLALNQALQSDEEHINTQESYSIRDLYNIMRKRYFAAKNEYERARGEEIEAAKKYISPERATKMAENIFVKGEYKTYRADLRELKKAQAKLDEEYAAWEAAQIKLEKLAPETDQHQALSEKISNQKTILYNERNRLSDWEAALVKTEAALRQRCEAPGAPEKIQEIAMGILRKNSAQAKLYETAKKRTQVAYKKYTEASNNLDSIKDAMQKSKLTGAHYTVGNTAGGSNMPAIPPSFAGQDRPTIITAAINGNAMAKNVVSVKSNETGKNWKLMSVFEQEEEAEQAFKRLL